MKKNTRLYASAIENILAGIPGDRITPPLPSQDSTDEQDEAKTGAE